MSEPHDEDTLEAIAVDCLSVAAVPPDAVVIVRQPEGQPRGHGAYHKAELTRQLDELFPQKRGVLFLPPGYEVSFAVPVSGGDVDGEPG